jgi:vancomycin resistance protein YoaR
MLDLKDMSNAVRRPVLIGSGLLAVLSITLFALYFAGSARAGQKTADVPQPAVAAEVAGADTMVPVVRAAAEKQLDQSVSLSFDGKQIVMPWRELGLGIDEQGLAPIAGRLVKAGKKDVTWDGGSIPVALDRQKGIDALVALKSKYDRPAVSARVDLESRQVVAEQPGYGMNVYEALGALEEGARAGKTEIALPGGLIEPAVTRAKLGNLDVGHVMGWFETHFPVGEKDRNYNLRVAAEKVNGHILMPGEEFSFNKVVGERTERQGFRVAHVIEAGEMIDGLAGGTCQISSTLHGAAWFAGLDIVFSRPHSRPSAYVVMGMDATVVYPTTDLVLRNPYDFPIAIRYVVARGTARVEVLGKERPWEKVSFERDIKKEIPYDTITREDESMPVGSMIVEQVGFPGYELVRRRSFFKDGQAVKTEKWDIKYPPTTEYVRIGTNPDPNLVAPTQPKGHGPMHPGGRSYRLMR